MNELIIDALWEKAEAAVKSLRRDLIHEAIGAMRAAVELDLVSYRNVRDIEEYLVRDTLNNPQYKNLLS